MNLNAERAALALARGKAGTCGIIKKADGSLEFLGFGLRRPVQTLRLSVKGEVFTEKTCPFNLIMRRGAPDREAWAVLADEDWNTLLVSNNTDTPLLCIALIELEPERLLQNEHCDSPPSLLAIKAHFDATQAGLLVIHDDFDFNNFLRAEVNSMILPNGNNPKIERDDFNGTESKYIERTGGSTGWRPF